MPQAGARPDTGCGLARCHGRIPALALATALLAAVPAWPQPGPVPSVSIAGSGEVLIGETGTFTVKFSNTGQKEGFGPYLALCLPAPGADGDAQGEACDGVTFVSAAEVFTGQRFPLVPANPGTIHSAPGAPVVCSGLTEGSTNPLCGPQFPLPPGFEGCQIVFIELLHGSFYPEQPEASIEIKVKVSSFADAGTALPIRVVGGFRFGDSPTGGMCQEGKADDGQVIPSLFKVKKSYLGPEGETATGPNFPRRYKIEADVADGQTLAPLKVTEKLPDDLVYLGPYGPPVVSAPPPGTAGGTVVLDFGAVTGGPGAADASFLFDFYAGKLDAQGHPVLDPLTCRGLAVDDIAGEAGWDPLDPRDPQQAVKSDVTPADHRLQLKCVAVQKSVAGPNPAVPGDVLTYTLDAQVSDFVQAGGLTFTDVLSDGLSFLTSFTPRLRVVDENGVVQGAFALGQDAVADTSARNPCGDGSTVLRFDVAKALQRLGVHPAHRAGVITGGEVPPNPPSAAATVRITYRARVQDRFACPVPSGDTSVDKHDRLGNEVSADALARGLRPQGRTTSATDTSKAAVEIAGGQIRKEVVARNGNRQDPTLKENPPRFAPGDTVTFRLRYRMPASDAEAFVVEDFLPAPVFRAQSMAFVPCLGVTPPAAGKACWGPADQIGAFLPAGRPKPCRNLADFADPSRNSVCFDLGSFDDPKNRARLIEILFTVTVTADPFADDLQLTNQVLETERNSFGEPFSQTSIRQIALGQPVVRVTKGAVSTCCGPGGSCDRNIPCRQAARLAPQPPGPVSFGSPGSSCSRRFTPPLTSAGLAAQPVHSDALGSLEPGDRVLFALVVENRGSSPNGAFDVRVRDVVPPGMRIPSCGPAVCVADGAGRPRPFTDLGGGLFGSGLELTDPGPRRGALSRGQPADPGGNNLAVITYELEVGPDLGVGACAENRAALASYAGGEGGASHVAAGLGGGPFQDGARACRRPRLTKEVVATSEAHTGFRNNAEELVIGEIVRFRITFEVPRGTWPMARLLDPPSPALSVPGLRFLEDTVRLALVSTHAGGLATTALSGPDLFVAGDETTVAGVKPVFVPPPGVNASTPQRLDLRLGDLKNTEPDCDREFVVVEVNALVENSAVNQNGRELENRAFAEASGLSLTSAPARLRIVEPLLRLGTVCPEGRAVPSRIVNLGAADAFDVTFVDEIPLPFCDVPPNVTVNPPSGAMVTLTGQRLEVTIPRIPAGGTVIVDSGFLCAGSVNPPRCIVNLAEIRWTSLPGPRGTLVNPTGSQVPGASGAPDGERNGAGGAVNTYRDVSACNLPGGADCLADLALTKTCSPGAPPTCSIQVTNLGPAAAGSTSSFPIANESSFNVEDFLPSGARLLGASGAGWTCTGDAGTISCRYDDPVTFSLAPGEAAPDLLLRIDPGGALPADNCARVFLDPPVIDPQGSNDSACSPIP